MPIGITGGTCFTKKLSLVLLYSDFFVSLQSKNLKQTKRQGLVPVSSFIQLQDKILRNYLMFSTTMDLAGTATVRVPFFSLASLKALGLTMSGCWKSLKSATFLEVRMRPLTCLAV